jgi:hypothetical protein
LAWTPQWLFYADTDELWAHQPGDDSLYRLGVEIDGPYYGMTTN